MSTDEDRAVILGYRHALMFVVVVDFLVSIVFLVQGWMMIQVARPVLLGLIAVSTGGNEDRIAKAFSQAR